jgi:molybdopterin molybdotransferase
MLAAAMNHAEASCPAASPKVAILATGDEVVPVGSELGKDQIVSSVPIGTRHSDREGWRAAMQLGIAKDDPKSLVTLVRAGSAADVW